MQMDAVAPKSVKTRSKITSGRALFAGARKRAPADLRTADGRRFFDLVAALTSDMGGADMLSESQRQIIRRIALIAVRLEAEEAKALSGDGSFALSEFAIASNHMKRLMECIGIKRSMRELSPVDRLKPHAKRSTQIEGDNQ
jgi:hypothetical protein